MMSKYPICPTRVRRVPRQFSWIDHRLVREKYIDRCTHAAAALYLFLIAVSDAKGMSYYADTSIGQRLSMDQETLREARDNLVETGLIAWKKPLYQVLSLDAAVPPSRPAPAAPVSVGDILRKALGGAA